MFAGNYAPVGWALCDGQLLKISENQILYALLGTVYGGDGVTTFGVPDMRGRVPVSKGTYEGTNYVLGQKGGTETVTLTQQQLPAHVHLPMAQSTGGDQPAPTNNVWSSKKVFAKADSSTTLVSMDDSAISSTGGNAPHNNMMPFMALNFIIATTGIFPDFP